MISFLPTPIGNKNDITVRCLNYIQNLNYFLCEDTRTFKNLMKLHNIDYSKKKFYSFTTFTNDKKFSWILEQITNYDFGLVSESGTPGISDPGKKIIQYCWKNNISFEVIPGANALIPSLVSADFDTSIFTFLGFLPKKKGRNKMLDYIISSDFPVFIYESVYRIEKTLNDIKQKGFYGRIFIIREISKYFEQKESGTIDEIIERINNGSIKLKGEFVLAFKNE